MDSEDLDEGKYDVTEKTSHLASSSVESKDLTS